MKFLFHMSLLALVVSCGGNKKSSSNSEMLNNYIHIQRSILRGQEILGTTLWTYNSIATNEEQSRWVVKQNSYSSKVQSIILKVEGELVYKLVVTTYKDEASSRVINIEKLPTVASLSEGPIPGKIVNGYYTHSSSDVQEAVSVDSTELGEAIMQETDLNFISINLKSACEMTLSSTSSGTLTANGEVIATPAGATNFTNTCGRVLSSAELKALDLSNVEVCDDSNDEYKCEDNKNMESLTDDL